MSAHEASYFFHLPEKLIAQTPPVRRGDSRLLLVHRDQGVVGEHPFSRLVDILNPGDLLVMNQSEVLPARLITNRVDTGGRVEVLLIRPQPSSEYPGSWLALAKPARRLRPGQVLKLVGQPGAQENPPGPERPCLTVSAKRDDGHIVVHCVGDMKSLAEEYGVMPLPPYIQQELSGSEAKDQDLRDRRRYQTVYAESDGSGAASVAAPTAGLHFTIDILDQLKAKGVNLAKVTLHVGPGTFRAPTEEQFASKRLHREFFHLSAAVGRAISSTRKNGGRVIAVGTTSLRVLETVQRLELGAREESALSFGPTPFDEDPVFTGWAKRDGADWNVTGDTRLFIRPPEKVSAADGLLTNFHLPGSSLLMLVASLMGPGVWPDVYDHAVQEEMRFYSYGDCMLILPENGEK